MFDTPADARDALSEMFDPALVASMVAALVPAIVLAPPPGDPVLGDPVLGGSRLGGTPDLPPGLDWPRPVPPPDPEAIAGRGNADAAAEMRRHLALGLPYAFLGQIDLAEAAALGPVAAALPPEGRLLFFYDLAVGPWETGTRPARVIWDRAPRATLRTSPVPADLAAAVARERREMVSSFAAHGLDLPDVAPSRYAAPARAAVLVPVWRLPHPLALEIAGLPVIPRGPYYEMSAAEQELSDAYREALDEVDSFDHDRWRRQQLLGSPMPEQDDPRYDAVAVVEYGKRHLASEDWQARRAEIEARARAWTPLLQVDLADLTQADLAEGSVFFVIRTDDLAARRFEAVVAVYQQT